jgi:hypothetical protein
MLTNKLPMVCIDSGSARTGTLNHIVTARQKTKSPKSGKLAPEVTASLTRLEEILDTEPLILGPVAVAVTASTTKCHGNLVARMGGV